MPGGPRPSGLGTIPAPLRTRAGARSREDASPTWSCPRREAPAGAGCARRPRRSPGPSSRPPDPSRPVSRVLRPPCARAESAHRPEYGSAAACHGGAPQPRRARALRGPPDPRSLPLRGRSRWGRRARRSPNRGTSRRWGAPPRSASTSRPGPAPPGRRGGRDVRLRRARPSRAIRSRWRGRMRLRPCGRPPARD